MGHLVRDKSLLITACSFLYLYFFLEDLLLSGKATNKNVKVIGFVTNVIVSSLRHVSWILLFHHPLHYIRPSCPVMLAEVMLRSPFHWKCILFWPTRNNYRLWHQLFYKTISTVTSIPLTSFQDMNHSRVSGFFLVSRLIWMVGRRKLRFVNFGLRIILTFLKIRNSDPANTSQNWHVGSPKFAVLQAKIEPLLECSGMLQWCRQWWGERL